MYAKIENGAVAKYPIIYLQSEFDNVSLPATITNDNIPDGYVVVADSPPPNYERTTHHVQEIMPVKNAEGVWTRTWEVVALQPELAAARKAAEIKRLVGQIDSAARDLYSRFAPFSQEYELREAQAQAFKSAGFTGPVPDQVSAYAVPAGRTAEDATNLVLFQAAKLRGAINQLGILRMKKAALESPTVQMEEARQITADTLTAIAALGAQL